MRVLAATGICVALAAVAGGAQAREVSIYRGKCGEVVLPSGPTGLSAAIRVHTSCGSFVLDGHGVRFVGVRRSRFNHDGLVVRRGRLTFYDRGRVMWSSRWRGMREWALGWTRAGLLVTTEEGVLRARTRAGRLVRILAEHVRTSRFDESTRTLLYVSRRDELTRTDGHRTQRLAALQPLRLGRTLEIVPLEDGRIALVGNRLVVLSGDGSVVASDRRRGSLPTLASRGAIALISTGPLNDRGRAREAVRLLRPGDRSSTLLFVNEVGALGCGHWPSLTWRGDDLLYSTTEGRVVVIDTGSGERIDLTAVVKRLPGEFQQAAWA